MKKHIILIFFLFFSVNLFAYDVFEVIGYNKSFQVESGFIEDTLPQIGVLPSQGLYTSVNIYPEEELLGFGFSNLINIFDVKNETYFGDRILLGASTRLFTETIPIGFIYGLSIQPEYEKVTNNVSSSRVLFGMGLDFQIGTGYKLVNFGTALNISLYPIMVGDLNYQGESKDFNISKYGRIHIGLTIGVLLAKNHVAWSL